MCNFGMWARKNPRNKARVKLNHFRVISNHNWIRAHKNLRSLSNIYVPMRRVLQIGVGRKTMNPHLRKAWRWPMNWISVVILDELIMIILLLLSTSLATDKNCLWHDTFGYSYDISKLHNINNYQVPDTDTSMGMFNMVYEFNFCTGAVRC